MTIAPPAGSGAVLSIPFLPAIEAVLSAGFTWAVIDAEHSPVSRVDQVTMIAVAQRTCTTVLVRVAENHPVAIGDALDAGADGVIVPMVNDSAQAANAVAASHYPPSGARSIGPYRASRGTPLCIAQIETIAAVKCAAEIAAVDGVDALMVGPGDLALSAGLTPGIDSHHPNMIALCRDVIDACAAAGKPAGSFALLGAQDAARTWELGWNFVADFHDRIALQMVAAKTERKPRH